MYTVQFTSQNFSKKIVMIGISNFGMSDYKKE